MATVQQLGSPAGDGWREEEESKGYRRGGGKREEGKTRGEA